MLNQTFKLNPKANTSGNSRVGTLNVSPQALIEAFGNPEFGDGDKTTGEYYFEKDGKTFSIYDYKLARSEEYSWASSFWVSNKKENFSIGSNSEDVQEFFDWLNQIFGTNSTSSYQGYYHLL